jgi:hypothetical protein
MSNKLSLVLLLLLPTLAFAQKKPAYAGLQAANQNGTAAYEDIRQANDLMQRVMHAKTSRETQDYVRKAKAVVERAAQHATAAQADAAAAEAKAANFKCSGGKAKANAAEASFSKAAIAFKQSASLLSKMTTVEENDDMDPHVVSIKKLLEDGTKQLNSGFSALNGAVDALNTCK